MQNNFLLKLEEKQKFHNMHEEFTKKAFNAEGLLPYRYLFILTNSCNLKCSFCYQKKDFRSNTMAGANWISLAKQLPDYARVTLTGGEPLIFPEFKEVFAYIAERFNCNVISNGVPLNQEVIDHMLSFPKFKVLSLSIDEIGCSNRGFSPEQWDHLIRMMKYFLKKRDGIGSDCVLDVKTLVLDENAKDIFQLHKYMAEEIGVDTHVFQFLKGSSIQHADHMVEFEDILKKSQAYTYTSFDIIKEQLELVRQYNLTESKFAFFHPKIASLVSEQPLQRMDILNKEAYIKENYLPCKFPWSSVHINSDGTLFPCLAVSMGNVKDMPLQEIVNGKKMTKFRNLIREKGTVEACNRCGWLRLKDNG